MRYLSHIKFTFTRQYFHSQFTASIFPTKPEMIVELSTADKNTLLEIQTLLSGLSIHLFLFEYFHLLIHSIYFNVP